MDGDTWSIACTNQTTDLFTLDDFWSWPCAVEETMNGEWDNGPSALWKMCRPHYTNHSMNCSHGNKTVHRNAAVWYCIKQDVYTSLAYENLCRELVCIIVKWTWYNGRNKFFHITSVRINTWKGVNQLKKLFFLNSIIFLNIYLKLTNHRYFRIKNPLFFTIHNKNGVLL